MRTAQRVALLHYSPIRGTVEGEPAEILPYLGTSRLGEPLNRHPVDLVSHGHAHHGCLEGRTATGTPVYNVAMPLLLNRFPGRPPFRVVELPVLAVAEASATLASAKAHAAVGGSKEPPPTPRLRDGSRLLS